ncbi:pyruvate dehydrogenase (acetyl-transferring) E1 component subunit alpha [Bacterioplanes sanyensis]|uniref:Pyruvate dehydrogenase E1 component subunit alpha n=1 Tax=Bacterioplanes sanyensis TaxID=1249553 RepID=A0A222FJZ0_9GAMM|nr:pyruvate dehydrogenase (acetyl-transferring) E1 component subunit alpha [Bacterioplanes sanyensis]ASP39365.1 pyruvate dehydrogenase (acetyl-transferring) E1 component subunit alpha [Bacterioplanes sanyensis]
MESLATVIRYLDDDGQACHELPLWAHEMEPLLECYRWMVLTRLFDQKAIALQRTGQCGTYPSSLGQEAISVSLGQAMEAEDIFVPYYRDHGTQLMRGCGMHELLLYWGGDERGSAGGPAQDFPICVPIATQCGHAVGAARALQLQNKPQAVVCTLGDGASSKGDFLEALNLAGVWQLPVVFVLNNNQWAISVSRQQQCGATALALKGIGAGIPSLQVDGNDTIAMMDEVTRALERARSGGGATLIEAISYRLSDHTTADDASRYRPDDEVQQAWKREPIARLKQFLMRQGAWSDALEQQWQEHCQHAVAAAVKHYLEMPEQPPEAMFDYLYADWPSVLDGQLQTFAERRQRRLGE